MPQPTAPRPALVIAALASALALAVAFTIEHIGGWAPCHLCVLARWPHVAVLGLAVLGLAFGRPRTALVLAGLAFLAVFGVSAWHVGVEWGLVPLPSGCTASGNAASVDELRAMLEAQTQPACNQESVAFLGISLAAWHTAAAIVLAGFTLFAARRR